MRLTLVIAFYVIRLVSSDYYRMSDIPLTKHDHRLYVTLRIPITMRSPRSQLFKIETFPAYVPDNPTLATVLKHQPFTIAVPTRVLIAYIVFQTAEQVNIAEGMFDISVSDVSLLPYEYSIALQRYIAMSFVMSMTFVPLLYYRNRT